MAAAEQEHHQELQQRPSPLLSMLDALGDATAGQLLMPRLHAYGSAGSVALACRQLRVLSQSTQPWLIFRAGALGGASTALVPERFPACDDVTLTIASKADAACHLPDLLPVLARLPALSKLALDYRAQAHVPGSSSMVAVGVHMAALQLPRLRALELQVAETRVNSGNVLPALARATQLTRLELFCAHAEPDSDESDDDGGSEGLQLQRLAALSSLTGLQHLELFATTVAPEPVSFLASLSRLTYLALRLFGSDGLAALSSLSGLRHLSLTGSEDSNGTLPRLDDAACGALGQLSMLTWLDVFKCDGMRSAPFFSALCGLQALQYLEVCDVTPATLAALSGLTGLTCLNGIWRPAAAAGEQQTAAVCSSVSDVRLSLFERASLTASLQPWSSLPAAQSIRQLQTWSPCELLSISEHCMQLTALVCFGFASSSLCDCPDVQRTAAISSLSRVQGLRLLHWNVACDIELAALAALPQVRTLVVTLEVSSTATQKGLAQLGAARQLRMLQLSLHWQLQLQAEPSVARMLLCGLAGLQRLSVEGTRRQVAVFKEVLDAAKAAGQAVPADVSIVFAWSPWSV